MFAPFVFRVCAFPVCVNMCLICVSVTHISSLLDSLEPGANKAIVHIPVGSSTGELYSRSKPLIGGVGRLVSMFLWHNINLVLHTTRPVSFIFAVYNSSLFLLDHF